MAVTLTVSLLAKLPELGAIVTNSASGELNSTTLYVGAVSPYHFIVPEFQVPLPLTIVIEASIVVDVLLYLFPLYLKVPLNFTLKLNVLPSKLLSLPF